MRSTSFQNTDSQTASIIVISGYVNDLSNHLEDQLQAEFVKVIDALCWSSLASYQELRQAKDAIRSAINARLPFKINEEELWQEVVRRENLNLDYQQILRKFGLESKLSLSKEEKLVKALDQWQVALAYAVKLDKLTSELPSQTNFNKPKSYFGLMQQLRAANSNLYNEFSSVPEIKRLYKALIPVKTMQSALAEKNHSAEIVIRTVKDVFESKQDVNHKSGKDRLLAVEDPYVTKTVKQIAYIFAKIFTFGLYDRHNKMSLWNAAKTQSTAQKAAAKLTEILEPYKANSPAL